MELSLANANEKELTQFKPKQRGCAREDDHDENEDGVGGDNDKKHVCELPVRKTDR